VFKNSFTQVKVRERLREAFTRYATYVHCSHENTRETASDSNRVGLNTSKIKLF